MSDDSDVASAAAAPQCQQTSFLAAWYVSTAAWYALAAAWAALALWPSRARAGYAVGALLLLGAVAVVMSAFKQTFHCVLVGADGHALAGKPPYENPRAFPSMEGALAAYAAAAALLHRAQLGRAYQFAQPHQRPLLAAAALGFAASLLWFHTPVQLALSLLLGALFGVGWQRVVQRVLAEFPGAGGAIGSGDLHV